MPANVTPQFKKAQAEFLAARTIEEKIERLKIMISLAPKHKGSENLLANLKSRLAKLKQELQRQKKIRKHKKGLGKEGDAQITLIGYANSGKSLLLNKLTRARSIVSKFPYTTAKPEQGMLNLGALVQVLDLPSLKDNDEDNEILGYANNSDLVLVVGCSIDKIKKILSKIKNKNVLVVIDKADIIDTEKIKKEFSGSIDISALTGQNLNLLKKKIFTSLNIIRIYTKHPGRKPEKRPVILKENSVVEDLARKVHKDFIKQFKFAKIWRKNTIKRVGLKYILKDSDVIELHI
ncbi:MAG: TGS domain-containing protein [Candidatus Pacearchaeota archaeon]|nr:MAG: TGS domain-containing protein [Candidatus Pacearchaeota archaeon]